MLSASNFKPVNVKHTSLVNALLRQAYCINKIVEASNDMEWLSELKAEYNALEKEISTLKSEIFG